jgi:predicted metalloendopeptidase
MKRTAIGLTLLIVASSALLAAELAVDATVRPGNDFFRYANGPWLKVTEIPPDRSSMGDDVVLAELNNQRTLEIIKAARASAAGTDARKIADYYDAFMDEAAIQQRGLKPLEPQFKAIAAIKDRKELSHLLGAQLRVDMDVLNATSLYTDNLLGLWVAQDLDNPARYVPFMLQGGLGMPDRDYYLGKAASMVEIRGKYQAHVARELALAGITDSGAQAARIFELEMRMAAVHSPRSDAYDLAKGNNHWVRADFDKKAPGIDWQEFFTAAGLARQAEFVVWQPGAITGLSALVASQPLETWKEYLTLRAIDAAAPYLPQPFVAEAFDFYGKTLNGTPQIRDRWKRGITVTNNGLGDAVGKLYVAKYFSPAEKARAEEMVRNLVAVFAQRIDKLSWMAPETKARAKAKLAVLKIGVGYPDKWADYTALEIRKDDPLGNAQRAEIYNTRRKLAWLGQPVDRAEWVMTPQTVNAVNLPAMNSMNFPAAILQPPYFDPRRPIVMDYGAIGAVIGHEISHSFDDTGAQFDSTGKWHDWWTKEDLAHFQAATQALARQYDTYRPFPDLALNGKQVLGESIADLAGLAVAYSRSRAIPLPSSRDLPVTSNSS